MTRQNFDAGQRAKADKKAKEGYKHKGTLKKEYKKIMGKDRDLSTPEKALFALVPGDAGYTFTKGLRKKGLSPKKIEEDILKEKMKTKEFRIGHAKSKVAGKKAKEDDQEYSEGNWNKGVRELGPNPNSLTGITSSKGTTIGTYKKKKQNENRNKK